MYLGVHNGPLPLQVHPAVRAGEGPMQEPGETATLEFQSQRPPSWSEGSQQGECMGSPGLGCPQTSPCGPDDRRGRGGEGETQAAQGCQWLTEPSTTHSHLPFPQQ